jgi:hypothetical protein
MTESKKKTSNPNKEELIQFVLKNSPAVLALLKGDIFALSLSQIVQVYKISGLEASAHQMCEDLSKELPKYSLAAIESFENGLVKLGLSSEENKSINKIYKDTIVAGVSSAAKILLNPIEEGKGFLYNRLLSEQTVCVLNGVLDFKKAIDQYHPELSDKIIAAAIPGITMLISAYAPAIGLAVKTTGILSKAAEYIKTDNLEKTVNMMQADLDIIKKDKQLSGAEELGTKLAELSKITGLSTTSLQKSGVTLKNIEQVKKEASKIKNPSTRDLKKITLPVIEKLKMAQKDKKQSHVSELTKNRLKENRSNSKITR